MVFTKKCASCNARMQNTIFWTIDFDLPFSNFCSIMPKMTPFGIICRQKKTIRQQSAIFWRFLRWQHFPGRGMVMDENGRNGRNWHLAQQITQHVIMRILSITTTNIPCNQSAYFINKSHIMQLSMTQPHGFIYNQIQL